MCYRLKEEVKRMSEKLYEVDQFYPGDFAQILTGVYINRLQKLRIQKMSLKGQRNWVWELLYEII